MNSQIFRAKRKHSDSDGFAIELERQFSWLKVISRAMMITAFGAISLFAVAFAFYSQEKVAQEKTLLAEAELHADIQRNIFSQDLKNLSYELNYLSRQSSFHHDGGMGHLVDDFISIMKSTNTIDQLRILDLTGTETMRVNFNNGSPVLIADELLQNKSDRYYFKRMMALKKDEYYLSPLDLNIENGKVETPLKPTIRIGMSIYTGEGVKIGYIMLNYLAGDMLERFKKASQLLPLDVLLIDSHGKILSAPNPQLEWKGDISGEHEFSVVNNGKSYWKEIVKSREGILDLENRMIIHSKIHPHSEITTSKISAAKNDGYYWQLLVLLDSDDVIKAMSGYLGLMKMWYSYAIIILLLLSFPISVLLEKRYIYLNYIELLKQAVEHAGEALIITDTKGVIDYINPKFSSLTGYTKDEAIGNTPSTLLKSNVQDPQVYEVLWKEISIGNEWSGHIVDRKKDGSLFPAFATITPISNVHGEITQYMAIIRDETEQQLLKQKEIQERKMESLSISIGGIAHEFNNILAALLGNTYLLKLLDKENPEALAKLNTIESLGNDASGMIKQMLTYSGKSDINLSKQELNSFFKKAIDQAIKLNDNSSTHIAIEVANSPVILQADPIYLQKVIEVLISNAFDAISGMQDGKITISVQEMDCDSDKGEGHPHLRFSIEDNGHGIEERHKELLFEPFFTTKDPGKGTGLGLSSASGIIRKHHGRIEVESELGKGSKFSVYIPIET